MTKVTPIFYTISINLNKNIYKISLNCGEKSANSDYISQRWWLVGWNDTLHKLGWQVKSPAFFFLSCVSNKMLCSLFPCSLGKIWQKSRAVTSCIAFISSCANPVLYFFAGKSYIRREGLAFMARLFEGTGLDSATRKSRQNSQNSRDKDKEADSIMLKEWGCRLCY